MAAERRAQQAVQQICAQAPGSSQGEFKGTVLPDFDHPFFFHQMNPIGLLIIGLKYFYYWFRFADLLE